MNEINLIDLINLIKNLKKESDYHLGFVIKLKSNFDEEEILFYFNDNIINKLKNGLDKLYLRTVGNFLETDKYEVEIRKFYKLPIEIVNSMQDSYEKQMKIKGSVILGDISILKDKFFIYLFTLKNWKNEIKNF